MLTLLLRRLLLAIPMVVLISAVIFFMVDLAPGSPMSAIPPTVPPEVRAQMLAALGADQPAPLRYLLWLRQFFWTEPLHGLDGILGTGFAQNAPRLISWQSKVPVFTLIAERLPQTLIVIGTGYALGVALAVPLAVQAAKQRGSWFDRGLGLLSGTVLALPSFLIATGLILIFAVRLGWLPSVYDTGLRVTDGPSLGHMAAQMVLPVTVLALFNAAEISRYARAALLEVLGQDHIRAARARGLPENRVLYLHALRNALRPVVTLTALGLPTVFGGAIVVEQIFRINGIGAALIGALQAGDMPVIQTLTTLFAMLTLICNLIADLVQALLDPRLRHG
jgi:peptide/nickel transport system permease protein